MRNTTTLEMYRSETMQNSSFIFMCTQLQSCTTTTETIPTHSYFTSLLTAIGSGRRYETSIGQWTAYCLSVRPPLHSDNPVHLGIFGPTVLKKNTSISYLILLFFAAVSRHSRIKIRSLATGLILAELLWSWGLYPLHGPKSVAAFGHSSGC